MGVFPTLNAEDDARHDAAWHDARQLGVASWECDCRMEVMAGSCQISLLQCHASMPPFPCSLTPHRVRVMLQASIGTTGPTGPTGPTGYAGGSSSGSTRANLAQSWLSSRGIVSCSSYAGASSGWCGR